MCLHKLTSCSTSVQIHKCIVNLSCVEKREIFVYEYYMMHFDYILKYMK